MYSPRPGCKRFNYASVTRALVGCLSLALWVVLQPSTLANPPQGTPRKIVSDDFTKNRQESAPTAPSSKGANTTRPKPRPHRRTYRLASSTIPDQRRPVSPVSVVGQLGITIWRLRPAKTSDTGARMLVRENDKSSEWVAVRVEADTLFREGDRVRLSIESPRAGYLYVFDRDLFSGGIKGDPMLIFPIVGDDNQVHSGRLIDIPAQDKMPFTARPTRPDQAGELLTIVVTRSPLDLPISDKPLHISTVEIAKWEKMWGGQSARFEMEGGAGEAWTKQEQQAAARKGTRQLTRDDPAPQTIYRVSAKDDQAILVNVRLRYAN